MGHAKPLTSFFVSVAATGERKSAVDQEALWPVRKRESKLREAFDGERLKYENDKDAWMSARKAASKNAKGDRTRTKARLDALGPAPLPPLVPIITCGEPTYEGACKLLAVGQPSIGIFAAEGGQFIGGHGMTEDAKLRTASGLSKLWDGELIDRIRSLDGFTVLPGRRVAMHLMAQPAVAEIWFGDRLLVDQGLMSRALVTAPEPASGTRMWREAAPASEPSMKRYGARLLAILERPLPLAPQSRNELAPPRYYCRARPRRYGKHFTITSKSVLSLAVNLSRCAVSLTSCPNTPRASPRCSRWWTILMLAKSDPLKWKPGSDLRNIMRQRQCACLAQAA